MDNIGDGNIPIATATGGLTPTLTAIRPERRRHGMLVMEMCRRIGMPLLHLEVQPFKL